MVYFDTNVLVYAFVLSIDTKMQKDISIKLFEDAIKNNNLILSEISLYEFSFISKKLKESTENI